MPRVCQGQAAGKQLGPSHTEAAVVSNHREEDQFAKKAAHYDQPCESPLSRVKLVNAMSP